MKITRDTTDQLIVDSRPWFMTAMLIGFVLIFAAVGLALMAAGEWIGIIFLLGGGSAGLVAIWAFARRVQIVMHRSGNYCERREKSLTSMKVVRHALDEISRAEVEHGAASKKGKTMRRVVLVIERGESRGHHPIVTAYDNYSRHADIARRINQWLAEGRASSA